MNCEQFVARLWHHFEGQVLSDEAELRATHAKDCDACRALLAKAGELTCRQFADALDDYVADTIAAPQRAIIDRHLSLCPECVAYLDGYCKTKALSESLRAGKTDDIPPDLTRAVIDSWSRPDN